MADSEAKSERGGGDKKKERLITPLASKTSFSFVRIAHFYIYINRNPQRKFDWRFEAVLTADNEALQCVRRFNMLALSGLITF